MAKPRCFVISPIGLEGSPQREHADDVFDFIIKPAAEELGAEAYRADHQAQVGKISEQMFGSILGDDLCIAILSGHNPNVFYELAVAQCAARPVIILIQKGESIPFDIKDLRVVEYDLKPRALRDKVYASRIVEFARPILAGSWKPEVPFGTGLSPLGAAKGAGALIERAQDQPDSMDWAKLLDSSRGFLDLSGVSLYGWSRSAAFCRSLEAKCQSGVKIRVTLLHPENPMLGAYVALSPGTGGGAPQLAGEIKLACEGLRRSVGGSPNFEIRLLKTLAPHSQVVANESKAVLIPHLSSRTKRDSPVLTAEAGGALYQAARDEFEFLWSRTEPALGLV